MSSTAIPTSELSLADAKQDLETIVDRVRRTRSRVVIAANGTPVAAIVSAEDLRRLNQLDAEREKAFEVIARLSEAFADVPVDELERQVALALAAVRSKRSGPMAGDAGASDAELDQNLIDAHVEPHPYRSGADEWRLKERGVPVWAIIGALTPTGDNAEQVAHDYGISASAVAAALAYYRRHQSLIDARLAANRAA